MRRTAAIVSSFIVALGAAACQEQITQPDSTTDLDGVTSVAGPLAAVSPDLATPTLPADAYVDGLNRDWAARVINGGVYQCTESTPVIDFLNGVIIESIVVELPLLQQLASFDAFNLPFYEALLLPYDGPQEYGYDGDFTNVIQRTDASSRRFWDIETGGIETIPMKGSMVLDVERVASVYEQVYSLPPALAAAFAATVRDLVLASETLDGGDHPLFSANAFASSGSGRIAMGDAILEGYAEIGTGDVAAAAIFAHEYAHHVQFQKGYFSEDPPSFDPGNINQAERTRYTELMADAMASYFLTHKRGAAMNWWRVEQFLDAFFNVGDCSFGAGGHHGTPEQRMRTSRWAYELASAAQKQGHILTADEFHDLFVAEYFTFIAPDLGAPPPDGNVDPGNSDGNGKGPAR